MSNNIIDSIQLSGVTYQIQGSGGGITVDAALDSGSTNPVANSAITTALGDKVNVVDNNVSAYTFENKIGGAVYVYSEHFAGPIYIRYTGSTSSSGGHYAGNILCYTSEWGWDIIGLYFNLSNGQITATTVSSDYFDIEIENGEAVLTFKDGYYLRQYDSRNEFVALTKTTYESGQSANVIEDTVYDVFDKLNDKLDDKQDTLQSGTNIKTVNNQSLLGSGNIDIQGGSTYTAGRGISIANDAISVSLPISAGTGSNSIAEGDGTTARGRNSHAEGDYTTAAGMYSHAEGSDTYALGESSHSEGDSTIANGDYSHAEGVDTTASNKAEHASGQYNISSSASTTFGDSGNTLFSVGNGTSTSARHNAFEIRQNGDIYLSSGGTDIKLQDHLGGGTQTIELTQAEYDALVTAGTVSADTYYIITDAQAGDLTNYYTKTETNTLLGGKADTSAITEVSDVLTAHTANTTVHTTAAEKTSWNGAATNASNAVTALGGLSLVKLTQAEYDALATKDNNTLYVIVN